jgi:hypothetical protein
MRAERNCNQLKSVTARLSKMHLNAVGRDKLVRYFQAHLRSVLPSEIPIKLSASRWFSGK